MSKGTVGWATTLASVAATTLLAGCGGPAQIRPVTGKVTVDDRPVRAGQLVFVGGPEKQKHVTVIGYDGRYSISLPAGEYKVGVEPAAGPSPMAKMNTPKRPKDMPAMHDPTGQVKGEGVDAAKEAEHPVTIPMKYRAPESSGFLINVTGSGGSLDLPMKSKG